MFPITSNQKNFLVLLASMMAVGLPVLTHLQLNVVDEDGARLLLRLTALSSFLIYLIIFLARPIRQITDRSFASTIMKNRRFLGIAFAGSHTIHLILIVWYFISVTDLTPRLPVLVAGGGGYLLLYLMLVTSFDKPAAEIGPVAWRRLHKTGLYWLGAVFAVTYVPKFFANPADPTYIAASILIVSAVTLRTVAFLKNRSD